MQLRLRHIARSVVSNWLAMAASMAVAFFLSPFLVHRLGNAAYGVWILAISSVQYFGLLDLGMRSSVLRYVSKKGTRLTITRRLRKRFQPRFGFGSKSVPCYWCFVAGSPRYFRGYLSSPSTWSTMLASSSPSWV